MLTIILIGAGIIISGIIVLLVLRLRTRKRTREKVIQDLDGLLKDDIDQAVIKLITKFQWYFKSPKSDYNRQKRRRIERNYMKFVRNWLDIPKSGRDVELVVHYLVQQDWKNNVVGRYIDICKKGDAEERKEKRKEEEKKRQKEEAEKRVAELKKPDNKITSETEEKEVHNDSK